MVLRLLHGLLESDIRRCGWVRRRGGRPAAEGWEVGGVTVGKVHSVELGRARFMGQGRVATGQACHGKSSADVVGCCITGDKVSIPI